MYRILTIGAIACLTAACGGGSNNASSTNANTLALAEYPTLTKTTMEPKHLKPASEAELLKHLLNGIRLNVYIFNEDDAIPVPLATSAPEVRAMESDAISGGSTVVAADSFSTTNVHVTGVDEADYLKYDGQHIYLSTDSQYQNDAWTGPSIRILATDPANASIREVGIITNDEDQWGSADALYLLGDDTQTSHVVTLRTQWSYFARPMISTTLVDADFLPINDEAIQISGYDVADPTSPEKSFSIEIDGYLQNSRKIDNMLYLVTRYSPNIPTIHYYLNEKDAQENEERIAALTLDDLLPKVRINGGDAQNLLRAQDCLLPLDLSDKHGYAALTTVIAIDLSAQDVTSAKCVNANVGGIYATPSSLYVGGSSYRNWNDHSSFTTVHKFNLGENIAYRSTGIIPGWLGWQDPAFRMDEHNGYFRIMTTERSNGWSGDPEHRLSILQDDPSSDAMQLVAQLPNDEAPATIGKPGEDLYAVRFVGDRAYAVTFERIDPLYVIDLSNPQAPSIAGELEVPGFSTYLHPIGESYLLGVGREADDSGRANGVKISLYDIRNIDAPSEINSLSYGAAGTWSSALYDLRALSFLQTSADQLRFTLPISLRDSDWQWQEDALHLFEVNGLAAASADVNFVGKVTSEARSDDMQWPSWSGVDRGVLHGDAVYYAHGNSVWSAFWSSPSAATGPH